MTNSIIIPSSDADKQRIKGAMEEISNAYTRIEAERDFIKEAIVALSEDVDIPKKYLSKMATMYHKNNVSEVVAEIEDIEALIETISR
jgi:hypothetical protein|tara:strand:- start:539 stop:802 length:264 start_codon:yes stop_codon:yes gene_type:complete